MKTILLLFDSLNKRYLSSYGCTNVVTPNFERLSKKSLTFDNCFVGSLPCMPARRDLLTGRLSFLHRSWGPMEPYDIAMTQLLSDNGIYTHLISDHNHYWEEGGTNYHTKYDSWEIIRGQEGDKWTPMLEKPSLDGLLGRRDIFRQYDIVNRNKMQKTGKYPIDEIRERSIDFLEKNCEKDNWFLQIESFDPHEPFFAHQKYRDLYNDDYEGPEFDWPDYTKVTETPEAIQRAKNEYSALVTSCDDLLGTILNIMDEKKMWEDTMLIVTTDHGYLLGEHDWWGKTVQPIYSEVASVPLIIYNPNSFSNEKRSDQVVQMMDIAPTILKCYGVKKPAEMTGVEIDLIKDGEKRSKNSCIFGIHGCYMNVTDGKYLYMRRPVNDELYNYTLMPSHMKKAFSEEEMQNATLVSPFSFTKGMPQLKIPAKPWAGGIDFDVYGDMLFDLSNDPNCICVIENKHVKNRLENEIIKHMQIHDAPIELYAYWGLNK